MAEVESIRNDFVHSENDNTPSPTVVHCRSGVGRTGVFILADLMIAHLQNQVRQVCDIPFQLRCKFIVSECYGPRTIG